MHEWDPHFEALLETHDPGSEPLQGGLLHARFGQGTYIYTGYSFFRQLPAGNPGAIRLFVNLLSAGRNSPSVARNPKFQAAFQQTTASNIHSFKRSDK
jgi:hypothetical protein